MLPRFRIAGQPTQYVEIELQPGEMIYVEPGAMIWKDADIVARVRLDGDAGDGIARKVMTAARNLATGEDLMVTEFHNESTIRPATIALGGSAPGTIIAINLEGGHRTIICQNGAILASTEDVSADPYATHNFGPGRLARLASNEDFLLQKVSGTGLVFLFSEGGVIERSLGPTDRIHVEPGYVVAFEAVVSMSAVFGESLGTMLMGGEGMAYSELEGPGRVWIQTMKTNGADDGESSGNIVSMATGAAAGAAMSATTQYSKELGRDLLNGGDPIAGISDVLGGWFDNK